MMEEYLQYGKDTVYDIVYQLAALDLKDTNQDIDHGKMTVVIWYKSPYIVQGRRIFILSFALGHDASLHCVLGLPKPYPLRRLLIYFLGNFLAQNSIENFPLLKIHRVEIYPMVPL